MKNCKGFSLIEIIVAVVIIAAVSAGIFGTASYSKKMQAKAQEQSIALAIVEREMNRLKGIDPETLTPTFVGVTPASIGWVSCDGMPPGCRETTVNADGLRGRLIAVITQPLNEGADRKEVMVRFIWREDQFGNPRPERNITVANYLIG